MNLYQKLVSGAGNEDALLKSSTSKTPTDWSKDGRFIVYENNDPKTKDDLWVLPLFGDRKPMPFLETEFNERQGQLSSDGRWMAYISDESGSWEVYVQPFPASGGKWQISTKGGGQPRWRRDGKELFYLAPAPDRKLMAVEVKAGATFEAGVPRALFETHLPGSPLDPVQYSVTADGQRFLIDTLAENAASSSVTVVLNWTALLRK